jgi:hypothetical protein
VCSPQVFCALSRYSNILADISSWPGPLGYKHWSNLSLDGGSGGIFSLWDPEESYQYLKTTDRPLL